MNKSLIFFLFLFGLVYSINVNVLSNYPTNLIAGSQYEANYSFISNYAGLYSIYVNIVNLSLNESLVSSKGTNCTEITAGKHICHNSMVTGNNIVSVNITYNAYLQQGSYPIETIFEVPQYRADAPTYYQSGGGSGGGSFAPRIETKTKDDTKPIVEKPIIENTTKVEPKPIEVVQPPIIEKIDTTPIDKPNLVLENATIINLEDAQPSEEKDLLPLIILGVGGVIVVFGVVGYGIIYLMNNGG